MRYIPTLLSQYELETKEMYIKKSILMTLFIVLPLLSGCVSKYRVDAIEVPPASIPSGSHFYVMLSGDGKYGDEVYTGSGLKVSASLQRALRAHGAEVTLATQIEDLEQAVRTAQLGNIAYVVWPIILHWEDRATEWSGRSDRITMYYEIYNTIVGERLASTTVSASSKWATFGGDHPEDLVPKTFRDFLAQVF